MYLNSELRVVQLVPWAMMNIDLQNIGIRMHTEWCHAYIT